MEKKLNTKRHIWPLSLLLLGSGAIYLLDSSLLLKQTTLLLGIYGLLFLITFFTLQRNRINLSWGIFIGITFRLITLIESPHLSDDFARFYWDGKLTTEGINPYDYKPSELDLNDLPSIHSEDFERLNSPEYFSVYPPFMQYVYAALAFISPSVDWFCRWFSILIILVDLATFTLLSRLLRVYQKKKELALLFFLNPLIILEFTSNLHAEAFLSLFVVGSIYSLRHNKSILLGIFLALAILCKIYPLLFLPFFLFRKTIAPIKTLIALSACIIALSIPLLNLERIAHVQESLTFYYALFEFNGAIYYFINGIGTAIMGYNTIGIVGSLLFIVCGLIITSILGLFVIKKRMTLEFALLAVLFFYFSLSTTLMPWYICVLLPLGILTDLKMPMVWTFVVFSSYSAFGHVDFQEAKWLVYCSYGILPLSLYLERKKIKESFGIAFT